MVPAATAGSEQPPALQLPLSGARLFPQCLSTPFHSAEDRETERPREWAEVSSSPEEGDASHASRSPGSLRARWEGTW